MDGCCVSKSKAIFIIFNPITHTYILLLKTHKSLFSQGPEVNASCVCVCIYSHIKRDVLFDKFATGGTDAPDGQKIPNSTNTLFFFSFSFFIYLSNSKKPLGIFSLTNQLQHPPKKTMQFQERERLHRN